PGSAIRQDPSQPPRPAAGGSGRFGIQDSPGSSGSIRRRPLTSYRCLVSAPIVPSAMPDAGTPNQSNGAEAIRSASWWTDSPTAFRWALTNSLQDGVDEPLMTVTSATPSHSG